MGQGQGQGQGQAPAAAGAPAIAYDLPNGWNREQPSSNMRVDQATISGQGGNATMAVFFFGEGGGGPVQSNMQRWAEQMGHNQMPKTESFDVNGYKVTWMDLSGTLQPSSMMAGPRTPQPGSRMLAAVVEGKGGPWFFKVTGPEKTLSGERDKFLSMLHSIHTRGEKI